MMVVLLERLCDSWLAWSLEISLQIVWLSAVVAVIAWASRRFSARLRYALWALVFIKILLPPSFGNVVGVDKWGPSPLIQKAQTLLPGVVSQITETLLSSQVDNPSDLGENESGSPLSLVSDWGAAEKLFTVWFSGVAIFAAILLWQYARTMGILRRGALIDSGPLCVELKNLASRLRIKRSPSLVLSDEISSPYLFGLIRPKIALPADLPESLSCEEIRNVMMHELAHWRRGDLFVGWLHLLGKTLFWFHPLVWIAGRQLQHERECACDELVMAWGSASARDYGESLLKVVLAASGRSAAALGSTGIFEKNTRLQNRLEEIMNYETHPKRFGFGAWAFVVVFALLILPISCMRTVSVAEEPSLSSTSEQGRSNTPQIVSTVPKVGQTEVDPDLKEITITFDRDMSSGMSWTGGGEVFPKVPEGKRGFWRDNKTCVFPVTLEAAHIYRVGINSKSHKNFRSADGIPTRDTALFFVTKGASEEMKKKIAKPQIGNLTPENKATGVDPNITELRVTFDMPMGGGCSWTGSGEHYPEIPEGKRISWTEDKRTCVMPVVLKPNWSYTIGLNSANHINFQSESGVPLEPVLYTFKTGSK